ncbi:MAG: tRNA lysidine(34) synthetase TilS [Fuerstiella sp.]
MTRFSTQLRAAYDTLGCRPDDGLLLAVSGGADSVALLQGTLELWPDRTHQITVAHLNHSLRGSNSDADAEFVTRLARETGLRIECGLVRPGQLSDDSKGSLEEAARRARYAFLGDTAQRLGCRWVATAHHADDQAETILHNILRGTGLRGLTGMRPSRRLSDDIALIRPLLHTTRAEILDFLQRRHLSFCHDHTNSDERFTRNRIRRQLLPGLRRDFNEKVDRSLIRLSRQANDALEILDALASETLVRMLRETTDDCIQLDLSAQDTENAALLRHILSLLWQQKNWPRQKMAFRHWELLAQAALTGKPRAADLPHGFRFERDRTTMSIFRSPDDAA